MSSTRVRGVAAVIAAAALTVVGVTPAIAADDPTETTAATVAAVAPDIGAVAHTDVVGDDLVTDGALDLAAPAALGEGITITGGDGAASLTIDVGFGDPAAQSEVAVDGSVVYADAEQGSVVVQATDDAVRLQTVIDGPSSSHEIPYSFGDGFRIGSDGERFFVGDVRDPEGASTYAVEQPWAFDATGAPVETYYEVQDDVLVQIVVPTAESVYPIVADPTFKWVAGGYGLQLTRAETRDVANAASITLACGAVNRFAANHPGVAAACYLIGAYTWSQAQVARGQNSCIFVQFIPAPAIWRGC